MKYKNILFCTDYSDDAESAFVHALDQAVKYTARLHFMNVIPSVNPCGIHLHKSLSEEDSRKETDAQDERLRLEELGALKKAYEKYCQDVVDHTFVIKVGSPDVEIITYADENKVDLIITDQRMPAMSGTEFLEKVYEFMPGKPPCRMIYSGYSKTHDIELAKEKEWMSAFISKPCEPEDLKAIIDIAIRNCNN